jgi:lipid A ethanolaminephosphotransferase
MTGYCTEGRCSNDGWDEALLRGLETLIAQSKQQRIFIVLHLSGSHGPAYHTKYPPEFEIFKPTCKTVILKECDPQALRNAYDNSIAYTDHVLASLTRLLMKTDAASGWLYLSDHGESLGENGLYLHGMPRAMSPREQIDIPFSFWLSAPLRQETGIDMGKAADLSGIGQGHVFHTVMGLLALSAGPYRRELDMFSALK